MKKNQLILLAIIAILISLFFIFNLQHYLTLEYVQIHRTHILNVYEAQPWQTTLIFFMIYLIITGLSLPGAVLLTLIAGAIFGVFVGTIIVSFASSIGATIAFVLARYLFRESVQQHFKHPLTTINQGIKKQGIFYLLSLRLIPLFPFFAINLVMAVTPIKTWTFYWVSQIGMLFATIVYVNAGMQLAQLHSLKDIVSPALICAFVLLGLLPLIAKKVVSHFQVL